MKNLEQLKDCRVSKETLSEILVPDVMSWVDVEILFQEKEDASLGDLNESFQLTYGEEDGRDLFQMFVLEVAYY